MACVVLNDDDEGAGPGVQVELVQQEGVQGELQGEERLEGLLDGVEVGQLRLVVKM